MKIEIEKTKKGFPALWEEGGGTKLWGTAIIITDPQGRPKKPLVFKNSGHRAVAKQALLAVRKNDIVVHAEWHSDVYGEKQFLITAYKIIDFDSRIKVGEEYMYRNGLVGPQAGGYKTYVRRGEAWNVPCAVLKPMTTYIDGEWTNRAIAERLYDPIVAAVSKSVCPGCRLPHYIISSPRRSAWCNGLTYLGRDFRDVSLKEKYKPLEILGDLHPGYFGVWREMRPEKTEIEQALQALEEQQEIVNTGLERKSHHPRL